MSAISAAVQPHLTVHCSQPASSCTSETHTPHLIFKADSCSGKGVRRIIPFLLPLHSESGVVIFLHLLLCQNCPPWLDPISEDTVSYTIKFLNHALAEVKTCISSWMATPFFFPIVYPLEQFHHHRCEILQPLFGKFVGYLKAVEQRLCLGPSYSNTTETFGEKDHLCLWGKKTLKIIKSKH